MKKKVPGKGRRRPLTQTDYKRLAEFRYLLRRFSTFSEVAAAEENLAPQQHQALLAVKGYPEDSINTGQLAERLGIRHHSAVGLVDRLVRNGLIIRRSSEVDGREVLIFLTPKAEKLLAVLALAHRRELERLAPLLKALLTHFGRNS